MDGDTFEFEIPADVSAPAPAPKRGRRASSRPAKEVASSAELRDLVQAMYGGVARLPGQDHWEVSHDEADAIAKPLARVLARQGPASRWMAEHADTLLLAFAACAVTLPRVYVSVNGGSTPSDGASNRSSNQHTGSPAVSRLLYDEPVGTVQDAPRASGSTNGTESPEDGDVVSVTADALRDAYRNLPQ